VLRGDSKILSLTPRHEDQDRSLWDTEQIAEGRAVLDRALALLGRGPYVLQAAIASLHAEEPATGPDRRNLRRAGPSHRLAGRRAEQGRGGGRSAGSRGRPRHRRPPLARGLPLPALDPRGA